MTAIIALYSGDISMSAAYRVAVTEGMKGNRKYRTKYGRFWSTINWRLPDNTLSVIWGVMRGNIRQRRLRLGVGGAVYSARRDTKDPNYKQEVAKEQRLANSFVGPRPR